MSDVSTDIETLDWRKWLREGDQYKKAGTPKPGGKRRLSPTIVYNVYSMALESYVMAMLDSQGVLPDNHTFTDLVCALEQEFNLDVDLKKRILDLEQYQQICSFADFQIAQVNDAVVEEFSEVVDQVAFMAHQVCAA